MQNLIYLIWETLGIKHVSDERTKSDRIICPRFFFQGSHTKTMVPRSAAVFVLLLGLATAWDNEYDEEFTFECDDNKSIYLILVWNTS